MGDGPGPGAELFFGSRLARDESLVDAGRSHGAPLVMIVFQPEFAEVVKGPVDPVA